MKNLKRLVILLFLAPGLNFPPRAALALEKIRLGYSGELKQSGFIR